MTKHELLAALLAKGIELNKAGEALFADDRFTTREESSILETVEIPVAALGLSEGGTVAQIRGRAGELGLSVCPLELGPHLRLQLLDQPEGYLGHPPTLHRAPPGSMTVASPELSEDSDIPKGFYLRRIKGVLWLRGYWSEPENIWSPEDHFVFARVLDAA
jgi:hypothetical protein